MNINSKVSVIIYHKNILSLYRRDWILDCVKSIKLQTYQDFTIYELNYGDEELNICEEYKFDKYKYFEKKFENHAEAMNFLLQKNIEDNIDIVLNINIDDINNHERFEKQIDKVKEGYDIVSCNFQFIDEFGELGEKMILSDYDIENEFEKEHNVICHPGVCYSRNFIEKNLYIPSEIPKEDFLLWKRTLKKFSFFILPDIMIYYRIHKNQITSNKVVEEKKVSEYINTNRNSIDLCRYCNEPKNKIKYNFCQKCNRLY